MDTQGSPKKRFLVVDDDALNLKYLTAVLKPYAECVQAMSGRESVELFRRSLEESRPFDVVFMDVMMPGTDGHATVQELREIELQQQIDFLSRFKLVMVTALSDVKNVTESFFKGNADLYLTKPVDSKQLIAELRRIELIS